MAVRYVLFYESGDDIASRAPAHFPDHWARCQQFHADGTLLQVGTFADPQQNGSMGIFSTREAAEAFVADDPFVRNQVVKSWRILEWNDGFAPEL